MGVLNLDKEASEKLEIGNKELFAEIVKNFPYPMHICAPDGTILLANDAFLKFVKKNDSDIAYNKLNVLHDPNLERWGVKGFVERAYKGEVSHAYDIKVPFEEVVDLFEGKKELISECLFQNMTAFPIFDENNNIKYIVTVFITSRYYREREEIITGIEYINNHWKDKFDIDKLADTVHISRYHYSRMFKQTTGLTPFQYYQDIKVKKLKEKLINSNMTIADIFLECGLDYNGNFAKTFKNKVGMSPSEYRLAQTKK